MSFTMQLLYLLLLVQIRKMSKKRWKGSSVWFYKICRKRYFGSRLYLRSYTYQKCDRLVFLLSICSYWTLNAIWKSLSILRVIWPVSMQLVHISACHNWYTVNHIDIFMVYKFTLIVLSAINLITCFRYCIGHTFTALIPRYHMVVCALCSYIAVTPFLVWPSVGYYVKM